MISNYKNRSLENDYMMLNPQKVSHGQSLDTQKHPLI